MKYLLTIGLLLLCISCEKPKAEDPITTGTVTFWTTELSIDTPNWSGWLLWIDGVKIGVIPKPYPVNTVSQIPVCDTPGFLKMTLKPGRHSYYITLSIPIQPPPNTFTGQTYYFDVTLGGCTVVRVTQ